MAKLILQDLANLQNETTTIGVLTANNDATEAALENTLSRDGTIPNQMNSDFDMNGHRILNLPVATQPTDPVRLQEVGNASQYADDAAASAAASEASNISSASHDTAAATSAVSSANSATASAASATQAQGYVQGLAGSSTTSNSIAIGAKTFTANTSKLWAAGQFITLSSHANSANYMHGTITSYDPVAGTLVTNILDIGGSGTKTDWDIAVSGTQGPTGPTGPTGPSGALGVQGTPTINQFATWFNSTTAQGVTITGLVKGNGASAPTAAVASTDYIGPTSGSAIQKASSGGLTAATSGTDYLAPPSGTAILKANSGGALANATAGTDYLAPAAIGTTVLAFDAQLFSNIPQNSQSAAYTLVATDAQKHIYHPSADTTARTFTIPANSSVAYPIGTTITFVNDTSGGVITIAITTDTLVWAGSGTTGSRSLAANGIATILKVTSTRWIISGTGVS